MSRPPARTLSVVGCRLSGCLGAGNTLQRRPTTDNRQHGVVAALVVGLLMLAPAASACPVCFGAPGDPLVKGATNGVWVLLGFVGFVQLGFIALFWSFWRRAKALRKLREQFRVIDGGMQ